MCVCVCVCVMDYLHASHDPDRDATCLIQSLPYTIMQSYNQCKVVVMMEIMTMVVL